MHKRWWLAAGAVILSVSVVAAACGDDDDSGDADVGGGATMTAPSATATMGMDMVGSPTMDMDMTGSPTGDVDPDLAFMDGMVMHHQSAIAMAEIALEQAERQEIKDLATEIISAQQGEIDQITAWREQWFPGAPQSGMSGMGGMAGMNMSEADMQMLREADPFDREFIDMMTEHHQSAIMMAQEILTTTQRPELRQLANDIITAQQAEIDQMAAWRAEWFGQ